MKNAKARVPGQEKQTLDKFMRWGIVIYLAALALAFVAAFFIADAANDRFPLILEENGQYFAKHNHLPLDSAEAAGNMTVVYGVSGERRAYSNIRHYDIDADAVLLPLARRSAETGYTSATGISFHLKYFFYYAAAAPIVVGDTTIGYICQLHEHRSLLFWLISLWVIVTSFAVSATVAVRAISKNMEETRQLRNSYIANFSHSLKSPIASIRALAEAMHDGLVTEPEKIEQFSGIILSESASLDRTVMEIMKLSRMQSHSTDFSKSAVAAAALFAPAISKYAVLCDDMGIRFHPPEGDLPPMWTNLARVEELLDVLLDNALKFVGDDGDIWLEAELSRNGNEAVVCVRDNGAGIPEEIQPRIFERFFKGDAARNERGSGLGLPIARQIVAGLDERIWFTSVPGEGSSFYFSLHTAQ